MKTLKKIVVFIVKIPQNIFLLIIAFYRKAISPLFPPTCRFLPTCSEYATEAIRKYGAVKGGWMSIKRISRCHPWHPGGYDPVP